MRATLPRKTILFLCPHGGAKSVVAASYFNRLAAQMDLRYVAIAAATEDPYPAVPAPVAELLHDDGHDVRDFQPRAVTERDVSNAAKVISMGCELASPTLSNAEVEQWNDVPQASEDLSGAAAAIRRHVEALVTTLAEASRGGR